MTADTKKKINKALIILSIVLCVGLTVGGVYLISRIATQGEEQVLTSHDQIEQDIRRETSSLTDDEFQYGYEHIMPTDTTDPQIVAQYLSSLVERIKVDLEVDLEGESGNYFGEPAAYLTIFSAVAHEDIYPILEDEVFFKKILIGVLDEDSGRLCEVYAYSKNKLEALCLLAEESDEELPVELFEMQEAVISEYALSQDCFWCDADTVYIDVGLMPFASVLNMFDYCWAYMYSSRIDKYLVVVSNGCILACADTSICEQYDKYYPNNDLAALYRVRFYIDSGFLWGRLRETGKLYI